MFRKWDKKPPQAGGLKRQSSASSFTRDRSNTLDSDSIIPSQSFHDFSGHVDRNEQETIIDLKETITNLKLSLQSHAESKAETMEHFLTLKTAHDTLFEEHQALQEQMDDAVELLKFMKEDKVGNEEQIEDLKAQVEDLQGRLEGSVVSATIEGLTKDKMELQHALKREREEREDMEMRLQDLGDIEDECEMLRAKVTELEEGGKYRLASDPALASMSSGGGANLRGAHNGEAFEKLRKEHDEDLKELRDQNEADLKALRRQHEKEMEELRLQHEEEIKEMRENQQPQSQNEETLREAKEKYEEDFGEMQSKYEEQLELNRTFEGKIQSQEQQLSECQVLIERLQQQQREHDEDDLKVQRAMEQLLDDKDGVTAQLDELSDENAKLAEQVESLQGEINELRSNGSNGEDSLRQQLKEKDALRDSQQKEINRLNEELSTFLSRIDQLERENKSQSATESDENAGLISQNEKLAKLNEELFQENDSLMQKIQTLEELLRGYQDGDGREEEESIVTRREEDYQQPSQSSTENADLIENNESLKCQIQILEYQLQEQATSSHQKELRNAELEKEMQERLAKRLATQMAEIETRLKKDIEKNIRGELEEEYKQKHAKKPTKSRSLFVPGDEESITSKPTSDNDTIALMEQQLRQQLQQVKEERERWHAEQEQFQHKVLLSQNQLEKLREGYKKKAEKDRQRAKDLKESNLEKDLIIDRMNTELLTWRKGGTPPSADEEELRLELEELREQQQLMSKAKQDVIDKLESELTELQDQLTTQSEIVGDLERRLESETEEIEKEYEDQLNQLQDEIDGFLQMEKEFEEERQQWDEEKVLLTNQMQDYDEKYKNALDKLDEFSKKMMAMESDSAQQLLELEKAHTEELQHICSKIEASSASQLEERLQELRDELTSSHAKELEKLQAQAKKKQEEEIDRVTSELQEIHSSELESLKEVIAASDDEYSDLRVAHKEELERVVEDVKSKVSQEYEAKLVQMSTMHTEEVEKLKSAMEEESSEQIEQIQAAAEKQREDEIAQMKADHTREMEDLRERILAEEEESRKELIESMRANIKAELDAPYAEEIEELKATIKTLWDEADEAAGLHGEVERLQSALDETTQEKEAFLSKFIAQDNMLKEYENKIQTLQSELEGLKESNVKLAEQSTKLEVLTEREMGLRDEIERLQSDLEKAINDKEVYASKSIAHDETVHENENKIQQIQAELEELIDVNAQLTNKVTALESQRSEIRADREDELREEIEQLQSALDEAQKEKESMSSCAIARGEMVEENEINIKRLQTELDELKEENAELSSQMDSIKIQNSNVLSQRENKLHDEIAQIQSRLEESIKEKESIASKSTVYQESAEENEGRVSKLLSELEELKDTNSQLVNKILSLEAQNAEGLIANEKELRDEIDQLRLALKDASVERESIINEASASIIQEKEHEIESLHRELNDLREESNKLAEQLRNLEVYNNNAFAAREDEIGKLRSALEEASAEREAFSSRSIAHDEINEANESKIANLQSELDELREENSQLSTQLTLLEELSEKEGALRNEIDQLQSALEKAKKENEEYSDDRVAREGTMKEAESKIESLAAKLQESTEANAELSSQIASLESQRTEAIREKESELGEEIEKLQSALNEAVEEKEAEAIKVNTHEIVAKENESRIESLQNELEGLREKNAQLAAQVNLLEKQDTEATAKNEEELRDEILQLQNALYEAEKEKENVASQNIAKEDLARESESKLESLQSQLDEARKENDHLSSQLSSLNTLAEREDAMREEMEQLKNALNEAKKESEALSREFIDRDEIAKENESKVENLQAEVEKLKDANVALTNQVTSLQMQDNATSAESEEELRNEIKQLQLALKEAREEQEIIASRTIANKNDTHSENEIIRLQEKLDQLREVNAQLFDQATTGNASVEQLMKDLAEVNANFKRLQEDHKAELEKIRNERDFVKDTNKALEDAVEDIQIEKEDLEAENEELVTKLADLTTQAKTMLIRNDEMETQLNEVNANFEERVGELESEIQSIQAKYEEALATIQQSDNGNAEQSISELEEENAELREVIDHLTSENNAAREIKSLVIELREKNAELAESLRASRDQKKVALVCIEDLKSDNENLRNEVMQLQERAFANSYEEGRNIASQKHVSDENDDNIVPYQHGEAGEKDTSELEAELQHCKLIINQMVGDREVFNRRLFDLMDITQPSALLRRNTVDVDSSGKMKLDPSTELQRLLQETQDVAMLPIEQYPMEDVDNEDTLELKNEGEYNNSQALVARDPNMPDMSEVEETIRTLTFENGQLAQRLGGAVAEKEFAMTTLSKIGAKMEELMERNKFLENMINVNTSDGMDRSATSYQSNDMHSYQRHGASRSMMSYQSSDMKSNLQGTVRSTKTYKSKDPMGISMTSGALTRHEPREDAYRTKDPRPYDDSYYEPSVYSEAAPGKVQDDPTAHDDMESTIYSAAPLKKNLDPDSPHGGYDDDGGGRRGMKEVPQEEASTFSTQRRFKVPGGEYTGQVNEQGQKHGSGMMKYENGNEYEGEWRFNKRDGKGTTKYASGNLYIGSWKSGKRHGFGVFHIKKTGDVYRGNWQNGLKSGPGVYEYADGELDVSFYSEDVRVGEGVRWSASRRKASRLVNGQLVGEEGGLDLEDAKKLTKKLGFVV